MSTPNEIADLLTKRHTPKEVEDDAADDVSEVEEVEEEDTADHEEGDGESPTVEEDEGSTDSEDDEEGAEEESDDATEYLDLDEDYHIKMRVDGEDVEVPLSDLIQNYAGDGAAQKRLHEATEKRKAAQAYYDKTLHEADLIKEAAASIVKKLDEQLHTPAVQKPPEELKRSNPSRYLQQMDAYEKDQERIKQSQAMLQEAFEEHGKITSESRNQRKAVTAQTIIDHIPEVQNEKTKQPTMEKIFNAGKAYGFTDDEINALEDPRMYIMAFDAARYRELTELGKQQPVATKGKKKVLRAGKTRSSMKSNGSSRQVRTAKERARASGKTQDVTQFLIARASEKRK